jgi:hypothetical protein
MRGRLSTPALLALTLGLGLGTNWARAQDKKTPPTTPPAVKPPATAPVLTPVPQTLEPEFEASTSFDHMFPLPPTLAPGSGPPLTHPTGAGFSHCPKCWADASTIGSGNCKTDCWFAFSSSRAFFGEPCLPPPPGAEHRHHHWFKSTERH